MNARLLSVLAPLALTAAAAAQSTALTYQGRLKNGASLASGLFDFRFSLWTTASGGNAIGQAQCVNDVLVVEGLFTTTIDFGQQLASAAQRFLEIEARTDSGLDCSNATGFVTISPRTPLTPSPVAAHANSAFSLDSPDGSHPNSVIVDNTGKIGVGTVLPTQTLHIASAEPTIVLQDADSTTQQVGYVSYRDSGNVERAWVGYGSPGSPEFSMVNARPSGNLAFWAAGLVRFITNGAERMTINTSGNVGIGTASPAARLDVRGDIRLGTSGQLLAPGGEDNVRVIRGKVGDSGIRLLGSGFSSSFNTSTIIYTITYDTPFPSAPIVLLTPEETFNSSDVCAMIDRGSNTAGSVRVAIFFRSGGSYTNRNFQFIAIGSR